MTQAVDPQYAAFLAWQASQGQTGQTPVATPDETPDVTVTDVLCALIRSARLPDEGTVLKYEAVIRNYFSDPSATDTEAAEA